MTRKIANIFFVSGLGLIIYSIVLYIFFDIPVKTGFLLNVFLIAMDISWLFVVGVLLILASIANYINKKITIIAIQVGGYLLIFSMIFMLASFAFNSLAKPILNSNGRIYTYIWQAIHRLMRPSLSYDFFIPLMSCIVFIVFSVCFQMFIVSKVKKELTYVK